VCKDWRPGFQCLLCVNPRTLDTQSQVGMSVRSSKRVGAQDSRYAAMSALYTLHSAQDANFKSGKEQLRGGLLSKIKTLKNHRNQRGNQKNLKTCSCSYLGPRLMPHTLNPSNCRETVPLNGQYHPFLYYIYHVIARHS
jgi:hypothetical protein